MSGGFTFRLKAPATERLDLSDLSPAKLAKLSAHEIASIKVGMGRHALTVGDAFDISGSSGETLTIAARNVAVFKPSKELSGRLNGTALDGC